MSYSQERDPTQFFSVVGAPYVAERHGETVNAHVADPPARRADIAILWVVLATLIAAISIFAGEISVLASAGLSGRVVAIVME
jgi:hypothetical protein